MSIRHPLAYGRFPLNPSLPLPLALPFKLRVGLAGEQNVQGEDQKKLDVLSDQIMVNALRASGKTAVLVSEELEEAVIIGGGGQGGTDKRMKGVYCVVFDPLDGSSNIDAGVNVGTIFGVYKVVSGYCVLFCFVLFCFVFLQHLRIAEPDP